MGNLLFLESVKALGLISMPVRSVLVNEGTSRILISPGSMLTVEQLKDVDPVTDLVVPNTFHSAGVGKAKTVYPGAKVWASEAIRTRIPDLAITNILDTSSWPFSDYLPFVELQGMPGVAESVFFHKASRSLIVTDLCFNLTNPRGLSARLLFGLFGTYRRFAVSRYLTKFITDRQAFERSIAEVFSFDFESIVMSHGDIVKQNAKSVLRSALIERGFKI